MSDNKTVKYDWYTYFLQPVEGIQYTTDGNNLTHEELMNKKNQLFRQALSNEPTFVHRNKKLRYEVLFNSEHHIVLRIANNKKVSIERDFVTNTFDSFPSALVIFYNHPDQQQIAIESDRTSFGNSEVLLRIISKTLQQELKHDKLSATFHKQFVKRTFWEILDHHKDEVIGLKFKVPYPNLPRLNLNVNDSLRQVNKDTGAEVSNLEIKAHPGSSLQNLNEKNESINNLVHGSSEGGGEPQIKLKNQRSYKKTGTTIKSTFFDKIESVKSSTNDMMSFVKGLLYRKSYEEDEDVSEVKINLKDNKKKK